MKLPAALKKPDLMLKHFDYIVLTVSDIKASVVFYTRVLQMRAHSFGDGRKAVCFGMQKINLCVAGQEPRNNATTGSGDLCLITTWTPNRLPDHLRTQCVEVLEYPVAKSGALGPIISIYFNDPDENLIEVVVTKGMPREHGKMYFTN